MPRSVFLTPRGVRFNMTDEDTNEMSVEDREDAYRKLKQANRLMNDAATDLGYEDVHALGDAAMDGDLDAKTEDAIKAMTNAYSWLNNGMKEGLLTATDEYE